jgi:hypothetical protein
MNDVLILTTIGVFTGILIGAAFFGYVLWKLLPKEKRKKKNLSFTEQDLREAMKEFFDGKEPDVTIYHEGDVFSVRIGHAMTGAGGFLLFVKQFGSVNHLKISYNGFILSPEQKQELITKLKERETTRNTRTQ